MIMKFWVLSSSISSSPLVSSIVTLYALILLYVPHQFLRILFSPVLIITGILLFSLLRLGATQKCREEEDDDDDENKKKSAEENQNTSTCQQADQNSKESNSSCEQEEDHNWAVDYESETNSEPETGLSGKTRFEDSFFENWSLGAPLEVIYEEDEEDEEEDEDRIERYASLSRYYPESEEESDDYSELEFPATSRFWDSPDSLEFRWEEEDREGLIEIALDGNKNNNNKRGLMDFHVEEDNLIEIDLSPARNDTPPASQVLST